METSRLMPRPRHFGSGLDQQQALHRGIALLADDDVIVDGDAKRLGAVDNLLGHLDVGARRRRVA